LRWAEKAHPVRDGRLRPPDPLGDLSQAETELVDEERVGARLLDRRQLLARPVSAQAEGWGAAVAGFPDERGDHLEPRLTGCAPPPLAGDQLVAAGGARTDDDRLGEPLRAHRLSKCGGRLVVELPPRLLRLGMDVVDWELRKLRWRRATDQDLEAAAESAPGGASSARQAPSPPSSKRRRLLTAGQRRPPGARGSRC